MPVPDRVIAFLPYFLPLFDGLRYSLYFFAQFPQLIFLIKPLEPIYSAFFRIPFSGMIAFFLIYFGIAENRDLSRFVRFNGMQAMMLDIILIVPGMLEYVVGSPSSMSGPLLMVRRRRCRLTHPTQFERGGVNWGKQWGTHVTLWL